jgi:hypothetical protein
MLTDITNFGLDASGVTMHSGTNPSGSLYVIDDFLARSSSDGHPPTMPHGYHVAAAAHQQDPEAQIIGVQEPGISEIQQARTTESFCLPPPNLCPTGLDLRRLGALASCDNLCRLRRRHISNPGLPGGS